MPNKNMAGKEFNQLPQPSTWWYDAVNMVYRPPGSRFMRPPKPTPELLQALDQIAGDDLKYRELITHRAINNHKRYLAQQ